MRRFHCFLGRMVGISLLFLSPVALAQLDQNCTVSVLNRNVPVNSDGSWVLPNVPANFGQVRARATCVRNGVTTSGESALFTLPANGIVNLPDIVLGPVTQIPTSLVIAPAPVSFTEIGQTMQLTVTAAYAGGSTADVTASNAGTTYTTSNPALVTVSADGNLTAVASGTVVIQATNEGAAGMVRATVMLSSADSDSDGIPDDIEVANGLNPNDPVDAFEDFDRDGLTNRQEVLDFGTDLRNADTDGDGIEDGEEVVPGKDGYVTNPLLPDTDGDGIRDALEILTGSDPTDPASINLCQALASIEVSPPAFALTLNTIIGVASRQLNITGHLIDNFTLDLTPTARGTNYSSSDLNVCNFGGQAGEVFAGADGSCTISVTSCGFSVHSDGVVRTFAPTGLSFISIPGFASNVDVAGDYAYVAAGTAGLQVVDVSNHHNPRIVGSIDTSGNANDVKVIGNAVLVADGSAGLQVIDVTNAASPTSLGSVDTPGDAQDVSIRGNHAYIADGAAGLQVVDISNLSTPTIVGSMATRGTAIGVDVTVGSQLAVIAEGGTGLELADISTPTNPSPRGLASTGDARDVILSGNFAFVADLSNSFTSVELTDPDHPVTRAFTPRSTGGLLMDVAQAGSFALGADIFFVNGVPVINVDNPAIPIPRAILDFRNFRDDNGTGIAADNTYVYLTAESVGDSRLYVGQYLDLPDNAGIPPTVHISAPLSGTTVIAGNTMQVTVEASDDVAVALVQVLVNGTVVATDGAAPYVFAVPVPAGATHLVLGARALDRANNVGAAPDVVLNVSSDPLTTVVGMVVDDVGTPVVGATVRTLNISSTTGDDGTFSMADVPTIQGDITVEAEATLGGRIARGSSAATAPVRGGVTNVGNIAIEVVPTTVYTQDFENSVGGEWNNGARDITPLGGRVFLGRFSNDTVRLSLNTLPPHSSVTVSFDLFIIQSWDGFGNVAGPDFWTFSIPGIGALLNTTFGNFIGNTQSFPDNYGEGSHPAYTGAAEVYTLGYFWLGTPTDGVYHLSFTIPHSGSSIAMDFTASNLQGAGDESWGLDNVIVEVDSPGSAISLSTGAAFDDTLLSSGEPKDADALARGPAGTGPFSPLDVALYADPSFSTVPETRRVSASMTRTGPLEINLSETRLYCQQLPSSPWSAWRYRTKSPATSSTERKCSN